MRVRFGFVAMALELKNASPSKTMTLKRFNQIEDTQAALERVLKIAEENLANTLRILKYAHYEGIHFYRFSSKLIPLYGHPVTEDVNFTEMLKPQLEAIGEYVEAHNIRVGFHPDHFTLLNSPKTDVFVNSIRDLNQHVDLLETMGLDEEAKLNIHVGGAYGDKETSVDRLYERWNEVPQRVKDRLIFENDDKTYTTKDTLEICQHLGVPMTLDVHHHNCNDQGHASLKDLLPHIFDTWSDTGLPPKLHFSSPKNDADFRAHADNVNPDALCSFLDLARPLNIDMDIMLEAKQKDLAVIELMRALSNRAHVHIVDGGTILYRP